MLKSCPVGGQRSMAIQIDGRSCRALTSFKSRARIEKCAACSGIFLTCCCCIKILCGSRRIVARRRNRSQMAAGLNMLSLQQVILRVGVAVRGAPCHWRQWRRRLSTKKRIIGPAVLANKRRCNDDASCVSRGRMAARRFRLKWPNASKARISFAGDRYNLSLRGPALSKLK